MNKRAATRDSPSSSAKGSGSEEPRERNALSIKDILIHVDTSPAYSRRLRLAIALAQRCDAALIGAYVLPSPDVMTLASDGTTTAALAAYLASLEQEATAAEDRFRAMLSNEGLRGEWRKGRGSVAACLADWARAADLVVLGQEDPDLALALDAPEDVILGCGRPVLVVPYAGEFDRVGEQALVGWNGSPEATRAVHDALPLLAMSKATTILSVDPDEDEAERSEELVRHLARHGLRAAAETQESRERAVADVLMSEAGALGCDLIVMGAYGHSRLHETILGGVTRDMLRRMTLPVLMAH
ncbi:MAG TPA: universal stress protein [Stellaceae bacterium]